MVEPYDVVVVGGGVTGTAILYVLSRYTNAKRVALIEKYPHVAQVNSHKNNNSQTLHFGDIETNYTLDKAKRVKEGADLLRAYVEKNDHQLYRMFPKMVLAVGHDEVRELEQRYEEFKQLFPHLKKLGREEIARVEPRVIEGRDPREEVLALYTTDGYAVDFGRLSASFLEESRKTKPDVDVFLSTEVLSITSEDGLYAVKTKGRELQAKVVMVAAGGHSLMFAYELGYGKDLVLLPVAGSFFCAPKALHGKVYTMQIKKLPFAAVHGDPDVANPDETRFGPTAKVLPMLERYHYRSVRDFLRLFKFRWDAIVSLVKIISDGVMFVYLLKNVLYDLPFLGTIAFLSNVRKIVPTIRLRDLKYGRGIGGIRPQVVNVKTRSLSFGDAEIVGHNIIFNITPSPGASMCLKNALHDVEKIVGFLGKDYSFDKEKMMRDLAST